MKKGKGGDSEAGRYLSGVDDVEAEVLLVLNALLTVLFVADDDADDADDKSSKYFSLSAFALFALPGADFSHVALSAFNSSSSDKSWAKDTGAVPATRRNQRRLSIRSSLLLPLLLLLLPDEGLVLLLVDPLLLPLLLVLLPPSKLPPLP